MFDRFGRESQLLSRPLRVHFAGWQSDTYRLQQQGWQLSAHQDIPRNWMQVAFQHQELGIQGLSAGIPFEYLHHEPGYLDAIVLPVRMMARKVHIESVMGDLGVSHFKAIDATPQLLTRERRSLEDYVHFAPALVRTQEIIVPNENVDELLERILKLQQPAKTERARKAVREEQEGQLLDPKPRTQFHAQILSFAA